MRRAREPLAELVRRASTVEPRPGAFRRRCGAAWRRQRDRGVQAPVAVTRDPRPDYDPAAIARAYEAAGAAAISVLTEPTFFDGSLEHLREVRRASRLPVLRKDFIVDEYQIWRRAPPGPTRCC